MALHEKMKIANVVKEIHIYLLERGIKHIHVETEVLKKETKFTICLPKEYKDFIDDFKEEIYCCRDCSLEEYGWEIMAENNSDSELQQLGMMVDSYEIKEEENRFYIILHRLF
jgi:hypothetical protein